MARAPRFSLALGTAAALIVGLSACAPAADPAAESTDGAAVQTLVVATAGEPRPYTYIGDDGEFTGYDIEIVRTIDEMLPQYEVKFEATDFQGIFPGLDSGRYNIVANNLSVTEERKQKYDFSDPYITAQFGAVVKTDTGKTEFASLEELAGQTTYGQPGLNFTKVLESYNEQHPDKQVNIQYTELDLQSQFNNLIAGQVDFIFVERVAYQGYSKGDPSITFAALPGEYLVENFGTNLNSALAFSKQTPNVDQVVADFNAALAELKANGKLKELSEEFFGADMTPKE
ncbi:hypothetical protein EG850_04035 [Gulosibacter macacae]|uniref:Solute-binding protein family 3/N-terminal domain-containing protein n=1 Tax=Gulosibacter macacae TaxID=2488791 RepID=A0A3P3W1A8_9MICO|nr:transporter substrate-binding domain-containing protein [Gulosibacter macacae]RRJ87479.1 hypothetical protein EG850_04035 [Gulosibacter macacae]